MSNFKANFSAGPTADAQLLTEKNVEARTILFFKADDATLAGMLPPDWQPAPIADPNHPASGASVLIIFTDRLLVQMVNEDPARNSTNQLVILAVQAKHAGTGQQGVVIVHGLSAQAEGAPGPYGVFYHAKNTSIERLLRSSTGKAPDAHETWRFEGGANEHYYLEMDYERDTPNRSNSISRVYSGKNPAFYRVYDADQGVAVLRSIPKKLDRISKINFQVAVPQVNLGLNDSQLICVLSQPFIVRQVFLPSYLGVAQLQDVDPQAYGLPYVAKQSTFYFDSPVKATENGFLQKEKKVWLDKKIPVNAKGICRVKMEDGRLMYIQDAGNVQEQG